MLIFALFARLLGVAGFGHFAAVISVILVAMSALEFGMGARVLRSSSDIQGRASLTTFAIVRFALLLVLPAAALVYAGLEMIPIGLAVVAAVYAAGEATGDLAVGVLQGERRSWTAMSVLVSRRMVALAPMLILGDERGVFIGALLAGVLGSAVFATLVFRRRVRPRSLFKLVRENLGIMFSSGAANMSQLDVAIVNRSLGGADTGLYASATRLFNPISLLVATLVQVLIPELASTRDPVRRLRVFKRARNVVLLFASVLALCSVLAPQIVTLIYGESFAGAAPVAVAVFIGAALSAISQIHLAWYYSDAIPRLIPTLMWVAAIAGLACIAGLSLVFGLAGAAVGLVMMQLFFMSAIVVPWQLSVGRHGREQGGQS